MREFYLKEISRWRGVRVDASASRHPDEVNAEALALVKGIL
jgi:dTMP kinase